MRAVVIGAGAREHAPLAVALAKSVDVIATPGNPGITGRSAEGYELASTGAPATELDGDLFVIGPEVPLVEGLADELRGRGALVFGPGAEGAQLEGSKSYMKRLAAEAGVPTAVFGVFDDASEASRFLSSLTPPYVVKTDGLAAGKGVLVTEDLAAANADVVAKLSGVSFGASGQRVVIEESMRGPELSLLVLSDSSRAVALPAAQDFKRLSDGDVGPNTGGMGAYSPVPEATDDVVESIMATIVEPSLAALRSRGIDYRGVLYAGCMLTEDGPKLVEFNVRFGDPEAEVVLARLSGDLFQLLCECAAGQLRTPLEISEEASVCVVLASDGYPAAPRFGDVIHGVDAAGTVPGVTVLHAGTSRGPDGVLRTSGGRVLAIRAVGDTLEVARARCYRGVDAISFEGMQVRYDIALAAAGVPASSEGAR